MSSPFGYWTFAGKNGLAGVEGTYVESPGCRNGMVYTPDPVNPAVLPADQIINALAHSRSARSSFNKLYPSLLPEEKERLDALLEMNPKVRHGLEIDDNTYYDRIQRHEIRSIPVRTSGRRGGK